MTDYLDKLKKEAKPCPFCNQPPTVYDNDWLSIGCEPCNFGLDDKKESHDLDRACEKLLSRWNKRPDQSKKTQARALDVVISFLREYRDNLR